MDTEPEAMTNLNNHQVKRELAREERFAGSQRRIVNQHTKLVLSVDAREGNILKRSEHL
jgi:hypothetical protein